MARLFLWIAMGMALAVLLPAARTAADEGAAAPRELRLGETIEQEIAGGQEHQYRIALETSTFVRIEVVEQGVDLVLATHDPDGRKLRESNSVVGRANGIESVVLVAERAGDFRIGVRPHLSGAARGRYVLRVLEVRPATTQDRARAEGAQVLNEARRQQQEGSAESLGRALTLMERALELYHQAEDAGMEGRILNDMGLIHWDLGRPAQALDHYERALPLRRAAGDAVGEAITVSNMGLVYGATGRPRKAVATFQEALALWRRQGGHPYGESLTLHQLGYEYLQLGQYQDALEALRGSLAVSQAGNERANEGMALATLGRLYAHLGEDDTAFRHLAQARATFQALGDRRGEARTLYYLAETYRSSADLVRAAASGREAAALFRAMGDLAWEARSRIQLAAAEMDRGRSASALRELETALDLARQVRDPSIEAPALASLAHLRFGRGELRQAEALLEPARPLIEVVQYRGTAAQVHSLAGALRRERGDLEGARRESAAALDIVESLRGEVVAPELRATYASSVHELYDRHVDLLMRLHRREPGGGHAAAALEAVERGRARALVELLSEGRLDLRAAVAPELLQREQEVQVRIGWLQTRLLELRRGKGSPEERVGLERELQTAEDERSRLEDEVRRTSPRYAEVRYPQPPRLPAIQGLLGPDEVLLEYALGPSSYLFVVTREGLQAHRLTPEAEIRREVRRLRQALRLPGHLQRSLHLRSARRLYELLMAPAGSTLQARRRLLIAPDGPLDYLPFEALLAAEPASAGDDALPYVLRRWEVAYVPSAAALASLRERRARAAGPAGGKSLVVFADPLVAGPERATGPAVVDANGGVLRGLLDDLGLHTLPPLPDSRREAEGLGRLFAPDEVALYLGAAATEENLAAAVAAGARRLHFATHALVSARHPARSALVLSRPPDSREDGLLQAFELQALGLQADLVVLSACETGLGRELKGEGLVGLTRAFLQAGAARVAASLWSVADRSTADLMLAFYRRLATAPLASAALRDAKLELIAGKRFAHPYYWAPFVLMGEP